MGLSYKHFLYGAVTFTSLLAAMLRIGVLGASVSPPMAFYFGVLYFAFIAWAAGQLWKIHSQQQQSELPENGGMDVPLAEDDRPSEETLFAAKTYLIWIRFACSSIRSIGTGIPRESWRSAKG
jgi:hypothetical protein